MRKHIHLFLIVAIVSIASLSDVAAQLHKHLYQDFDTLIDGKPYGWTQEYSVCPFGICPNWRFQTGGSSAKPETDPIDERNPNHARSGTKNALFQYYSATAETKLVSPKLDMHSAVKPMLKFYRAMDSRAGNTDYLEVYYRASKNGPWHLIKTYTDTKAAWKYEEFLLLDSLTSDYYIAFEGISQLGWGVCVDSVVIVDTDVSTRTIQSVTVHQASTEPIPQNAKNMPVLRIDINVAGNDGDLLLNSIKINSLNTSDNDIDTNSVNLYVTSDSVFNLDFYLGTTRMSGRAASLTGINYKLPTGLSCIWIAYNIKSSATPLDYIDASISANDIVTSAGSFPSSLQSPAGNRKIVYSVFFDDFESIKSWTFAGTNNEWQIGYLKTNAVYPANLIGYPKPTKGFSGQAVLATDISGTGSRPYLYEKKLPDHGWSATTPYGQANALFFKNTYITFQQYLNFDNSDNAYLDCSTDSGITWKQIWAFPHNGSYISNKWQKVSYDTKGFIDRQRNVQLRFSIGTTDSTWELSGWCIDDLSITGEYVRYDMGITKIISPSSSCGKTKNENVTVMFKNTGPSPLNGAIPVSYTFANGTPVLDTLNASLQINDSVIFTFKKQIDLSRPGYYNLFVQSKASYSQDQDNRNDTMSTRVFSIPDYTLPRKDDFDNQSYWSTGGMSSTWKCDQPTGSVITYTASGKGKAWETFRNYSVGAENSYVESPCYNLAGITNPVIEFKYFSNNDSALSGAAVYYSIDGGSSWVYIPKDSYTFKWNWYNATSQNMGGTSAFTGTTYAWLTARQFLPAALANQAQVKFRFTFTCDQNDVLDGFAFDDVVIQQAPPDVGVTSVNSLVSACPKVNSPYVKVTVKNFGIRKLTSGKDTIIIGLKTDVLNSKVLVDTFKLSKDLNQNDTIHLTFKKPLDIVSIAGDYKIDVFTMIENDKIFYDSINNDSAHLNLTIYTNPMIGLPDSIRTRQPDTIVLRPTFNALYVYKWQDNSTSSTYNVPKQGFYNVMVTNNTTGCVSYDTTKIILIFNNVSLHKIVSPKTVCDPVSNIYVTLQVKNVGNDSLNINDKIEMNYEFDNGPRIQDTLILTKKMAPTDTINFTIMKSTVSMPTITSYNIKAYLHLTGDTIRTNDTLLNFMNVYGSPTVDAGPDTTIAGLSYTMAAPAGFKSYTWTDMTTRKTFTGQFYIAQTYGYHKITITDNNNCPAFDSAFIKLIIHDIGPKRIESPISACSFKNPVQLTYTYANLGTDTIKASESVYIGYRLNGSSWTRDTITLTQDLLPRDSIIYVFTKTDNLSTTGLYEYEVYTRILGDIKLINDTLKDTVYAHGYPTVDLCGGKCTNGNLLKVQALSYTFDAGAGLNYGYLWNDGTKKQTLTSNKSGSFIITKTDTVTGCYTKDTAVLYLTIIDGSLSKVILKDTMCMDVFSKVNVEFLNNGTTNLVKNKDTVWFGYKFNFYNAHEDAVLVPILLGPGVKLTHSFINVGNEILPGYNDVTFWTRISGDMRTSNDSISKLIYANPSPAAFDLGSVYSVTNDTIKSTTDVLLDPGAYSSYLWNNNSTNSVLYASTTGWYKVTVSNVEGCTLTDSIYVKIYNGLPEYKKLKGKLIIYPVPASTVLNVNFDNTAGEDLIIEIISADGKQIYNRRIEPDQQTFSEILDVTSYPKGFYFVRVYNHNFVQVEKLIIQ